MSLDCSVPMYYDAHQFLLITNCIIGFNVSEDAQRSASKLLPYCQWWYEADSVSARRGAGGGLAWRRPVEVENAHHHPAGREKHLQKLQAEDKIRQTGGWGASRRLEGRRRSGGCWLSDWVITDSLYLALSVLNSRVATGTENVIKKC